VTITGTTNALSENTKREAEPSEFLVLATEELFAGKVKAMIDRRHPRDLYDLFRFTKSNLPHDPEILRKLAVLFSSTMDRDFHTYKIDRIAEVDAAQVESLLYPLLKADDRPALAEMLAATKPLREVSLITNAKPHISLPSRRANTVQNCYSLNSPKSWRGFASIRRSSGKRTTSLAIWPNQKRPDQQTP
jgi:hypothetical protein